MPLSYSVILGKAVKSIAKLRGGGSALPGLFVEKIDPKFISRTLANLPQGIVVVSGTNGKTTTTKMVVELLESQGLKVFTNRTGSNFTRGVAAALLGEVNTSGVLDADIAVLELDEAHAVHFVRTVKPRYTLLLNVMRDQLDRFGEIDYTAGLLQKVAEATTDIVVINREDPRLRQIGAMLPAKHISYFGLDPKLQSLFPNDDDFRGSNKSDQLYLASDVLLSDVDDHTASIHIDRKAYRVTLKLDGVYNIFNAVAALGLAKAVVGKDLDIDSLLKKLGSITPAFGRGEILTVSGHPLELVLVKNPGGFRLGLKSFDSRGTATMIAINDNYADGRDMSWLWDVNFDSLKEEGVAMVSGIRAFDMALRLQYDDVAISSVEVNLAKSLKQFVSSAADKPKRIYCSYTAMLAIRRELSKITDVEVVS